MHYGMAIESVIDTAHDICEQLNITNPPVAYLDSQMIHGSNGMMICAALLRLSANLEQIHEDLERIGWHLEGKDADKIIKDRAWIIGCQRQEYEKRREERTKKGTSETENPENPHRS